MSEESKVVIGYKGTSSDMTCRGVKYELGKTYTVVNRQVVEVEYTPEEPTKYDGLEICTSQVIHYCNNLEDTFAYYPAEGSRFFKIEVLGEYKDTPDKSCATKIRFVEEIKQQEVLGIFKAKKRKQKAKQMGLYEMYELQKNFPDLIVGGSLSLFLQGYNLERWGGGSDFDVILPYWQDLSEVDGVSESEAKNSGNTFDETHSYKGRKVDVVVSPHQKYVRVKFEDMEFKCNPVVEVLKYKVQYALQKGGSKHLKDILELLEANKDKA